MQSCGSCGRSIKISTAYWHAWEYKEKNDVQKLKKHVKSKCAVERSQSKRLQHTEPNVSLGTEKHEHNHKQVAMALLYYSTVCY